METVNLPEQPTTETVVEQTPEATPQAEAPVTETPAAEPTPEPQPAPVVPIEPDYTPQTVAARFKENQQALLKELGYDDFAIGALDYYRKTGDLAAYWEAKHINWLDKNQVSDEQILEAKLKEQYQKYQFAPDQVKFLVQRDLKKQYGIGDELLDPDSDEAVEAQLKRQMDAFEYRQQKAQQQAQFKAPEPQQPEPEAAPEVVQAQVRQGLLQDPTVQGFLQAKAVKFGEYTHAVENPEAVLQVLYNEQYAASLAYQKDAQGNVVLQNGQPVTDKNRLLKIATYASNPDAVEQKLIEYGKVLGKKMVEDEAEVVPKKEEGSPVLPQQRTVLDALADKLSGR